MPKLPSGRWVKRLLVVAGLMVLVAGVFVTESLFTRVEQTSYCVKCHEIQPAHYAWSISSHSRIDCLFCHGGGDTSGGKWERRKFAVQNALVHYFGDPEFPFETRMLPESELCLQCHSVNRMVTPSGDLIIPHRDHVTVTGTPCVACHRSVVHARVGKRMTMALERNQRLEESVQTVRGDLDALTAADRIPSMGICVRCHDGNTATDRCAACHSHWAIPDNHTRQNWDYAHGRDARGDIYGCLYCHAVIDDTVRPGETITFIDGVRNNPFCVNCHTQLPVTHDSRWRLRHAAVARQDREGCLVCHDQEQERAVKPQIVACNACHQAIHPEGYRKQHPRVVAGEGASSCFRCHDTASCSNCHTQGRLPL